MKKKKLKCLLNFTNKGDFWDNSVFTVVVILWPLGTPLLRYTNSSKNYCAKKPIS